MKNLENLQKNLGLEFKNTELLETSLTHRSYLNEHKDIKVSNERLEFLGDAVLQLLSSHFLYEKFRLLPEGELTNLRAALVCTPSLAEISRQLKVGDYLFLSRGEEDSGGRSREYILANAFEAILGAIVLDRGLKQAKLFLEKFLFPKIEEIYKNQNYRDDKSRFQEMAQEKYDQTPEYRQIKAWGPDHDKQFLMGVYLSQKLCGQGEGSSKQKAEQAAAKDALTNINLS